MVKPSVDELLRGSAEPLEPSIALNAALDALVVEARTEAGRRRSTRRRQNTWLVPGIVVAGVALTAGAVVFTPNFDPDMRVPIEYVTDTGVEVSCTYAMRVGSVIGGENPELREWVTSQDWTGVGQRIYDDAIAHPFVPEGETSAEGNEWTPELVDAVSWFDAMDRQILGSIPEGLPVYGDEISGSSDCTGQLH